MAFFAALVFIRTFVRNSKELRGVRLFGRAEIIPSEPAPGHAGEGKAHKLIVYYIYMVPVQFITHTTATIGYEDSAMLALRGGCKWIQLRMKNASDDEVEPIAVRLLEQCRKNQATFILDDRVELCKKIKADGVHLGKHDMPVDEAREVLGHDFIIGGTANTIDDIRQLKRLSADYVGCGPFRFTTTKEKLSPVIGLEGYKQIMQQVEHEALRIPICAIGGIELDDVMPILETGVHGIAVSGAILRADDPVQMMQSFLNADK